MVFESIVMRIRGPVRGKDVKPCIWGAS